MGKSLKLYICEDTMKMKIQNNIIIAVCFFWIALWATFSCAGDIDFDSMDTEMAAQGEFEQESEEWIDSPTIDQKDAWEDEQIDVRVYMPAAGGTFFVGQDRLVSWTTPSISQEKYPYVNIDLIVYDYNGNQDIIQTLELAHSVNNDGDHTVRIPTSTIVAWGYTYRIRVTADIGNSIYWESGGFSISHAYFTAPEYSATICKGADLEVNWHPVGVLDNLVVCLKSETTGVTLIKQGINDILSSTQGSYSLDVPYTLKSGDYELSIRSSDGKIYDSNFIEIGENCYTLRGVWDLTPPGVPVSDGIVQCFGLGSTGSIRYSNDYSGLYAIDLQTRKVNWIVERVGHHYTGKDNETIVFKGKFKTVNVIEGSYECFDYKDNHIPCYVNGPSGINITATRLIKAE